jgi:protoporphyrinogen oxidase
MRVIVVGGGLAGMASAAELARLGHRVTVFEASGELGGVARSFQMHGARYPVAYHHILASDATLLRYLRQLGLGHHVRWSRPGVALRRQGRSYDLSRPADLLRFPMGPLAKAQLLRLALLAGRGRAPGRDGLAAIDAGTWLRGAAPADGVRDLFDQLVRARFGVPLDGVSAAYLQQRLAAGEGGRPLGYLPGRFWTEALIDGLRARLLAVGVGLELSRPVEGFAEDRGRICAVHLADGDEVPADAVVAAVTPDVVRRLLPHHEGAWLDGVDTVGVVSCVMETEPVSAPAHYWTTCLDPGLPFAAVFRWELSNPQLASPGRSLLNFSRYAPTADLLGLRPGDQRAIMDALVRGFCECFDVPLRPRWSHVTIIPRYTPVYAPGFRVAPVRSAQISNLFFAGNFRTFPAVATTGSALQSGEDAAHACHELGGASR